jgi:hypothetical protein
VAEDIADRRQGPRIVSQNQLSGEMAELVTGHGDADMLHDCRLDLLAQGLLALVARAGTRRKQKLVAALHQPVPEALDVVVDQLLAGPGKDAFLRLAIFDLVFRDDEMDRPMPAVGTNQVGWQSQRRQVAQPRWMLDQDLDRHGELHRDRGAIAIETGGLGHQRHRQCQKTAQNYFVFEQFQRGPVLFGQADSLAPEPLLDRA